MGSIACQPVNVRLSLLTLAVTENRPGSETPNQCSSAVFVKLYVYTISGFLLCQ